jgi:hypothetical protein
MRLILLVIALSVGVAAPAHADDQADFLKATPPKFVFVLNIDAEKDLLKVVGYAEKFVPTTVEMQVIQDGKKVWVKDELMRSVYEYSEEEMAVRVLIVTTVGGAEVPVSDYSKLKGKTVLFAPGGLPELFRQVYDNDAYVISFRPARK